MLGGDEASLSFGDQQDDAPAPPGAAPPMSLADLIADDEEDGDYLAPRRASLRGGRRSSAGGPAAGGREFQRLSLGGDFLAEELKADTTDHELTAGIPSPGARTRMLADHTGGVMQTNAGLTQVQGMELTTAVGGILGESAGMEETSAPMEFTAAVGGIVRGKGRLSAEPGPEEVEGLTNTLSRINGKQQRGAAGAPVAMEMTGTFGRILSSAIAGGADGSHDASTEDEAEAPAPAPNKTYVDDNVTMFTPLSRIKSRRGLGAAAEQRQSEGSPELEPRPRTRSRTPTKAGGRRRSTAPADPNAVTFDTFLEEIGAPPARSPAKPTRPTRARPLTRRAAPRRRRRHPLHRDAQERGVAQVGAAAARQQRGAAARGQASRGARRADRARCRPAPADAWVGWMTHWLVDWLKARMRTALLPTGG